MCNIILIFQFLVSITVICLLQSQVGATDRVRCFTCSVDFRSTRFSANDSCLFPKERDKHTDCSETATHCKAAVTRINGVLVQIQRTCDTGCVDSCTEKGFGIASSECTYCCIKDPKCGWQAVIKSSKLLFTASSSIIISFSLFVISFQGCIHDDVLNIKKFF